MRTRPGQEMSRVKRGGLGQYVGSTAQSCCALRGTGYYLAISRSAHHSTSNIAISPNGRTHSQHPLVRRGFSITAARVRQTRFCALAQRLGRGAISVLS
jgi:hypothetical protein